MKALLLLSILISLGLNLGCTSPQGSKQACQEPDWFEIGRREGSIGQQIHKQKEELYFCSQSNTENNYAQYIIGRSAGLVEYCTPENGFELARSNEEYSPVCPKEVEGDFLSAYVKGQMYRELREANQKIDTEISSLNTEMNKKTLNKLQTRNLNLRIKELRTTKSRIENDAQEIEKSL